MPDASIKGIEFAVQGETNGASKAIDRLVGKMAKLQSVLGNTKSASGYSRSMQNISKATSKTLSKFSKALVATPIKALTDRVKSATGALSKLGAAFKRIVFYRFIRSVIREIGDAFKYGVNNLYAWSQAADGRFAASMDRIATAFAYFKNSIGAAVAPLINALAPAIDYVIDKAVALLNVINQLFARLTGATYWTKAIKQANAYGDAASSAGGAAKEALRYLAPFDELNVLPSDNGSGGGGGGGGSSGGGLFEIQQDFSESVSNFAQMVKDAWNSGDWEEVGRFLGGKVNDLINNLPWAKMGANVGKFINALFGTTYWTLDTVNFTNLGNKIAEFVNNAISNINWDIAGRLSVKQFTVILDTIIGFIEGLDWDLVASSISEFVGGAISEFNGWMDDQDWSGLGTTIGSGINKILTETPWEDFIPSMVTFATDILTTINAALGEIHWGPWNEDGTVLNKLYNGLKNADWAGLWDQAKQLISNTWPVWTLALAINLLPSIGSIVGTITKTALLNAIFGGGSAAGAHLATGGAAATGIQVLEGGVLAVETVALISIVSKLKTALDTGEFAQTQEELGAATYSTYEEALDAAFNDAGNKHYLESGFAGGYAARMPVQLESGEWVLSDDGKTTIADLEKMMQDNLGSSTTTIPGITYVDDIPDTGDPNTGFLGNLAGKISELFSKDHKLSITASVDDVTDDIPTAKKEFSHFSGKFESATDDIPETEKSSSKWKALFSIPKDLIPDNKKSISNMTADITTKSDASLNKTISGMKAGISSRSLGKDVTADVTGLGMGFSSRTLGTNVTAAVTGRTMGFSGRTLGTNVTAAVTGRTMGFQYRSLKPGVYAPVTGRTMGFQYRTLQPGVYAPVTGRTMGFQYRNFAGNVLDPVTGRTMGFQYRNFTGGNVLNPVTGMTMGFQKRSFTGGTVLNPVTGMQMGFSSRTLESPVTAPISTTANFTSATDSISYKTLYGYTADINSYSDQIYYEKKLSNFAAEITTYYSNDASKKYAAEGGAYYSGSWHDIPQYAGGTNNAHGSVFIAGEAGPEVVGHIGGRTEVLNQSQLAATMFAAVKNAMAGIRFHVSGETQTYDTNEDNGENTVRAIITALQTLGLTGDALDNVQAHISSQEVYDSVRESNRRNTRMTGVNAFA